MPCPTSCGIVIKHPHINYVTPSLLMMYLSNIHCMVLTVKECVLLSLMDLCFDYLGYLVN